MVKMDNMTICKCILSYFSKSYFRVIESENTRQAYVWENIGNLLNWKTKFFKFPHIKKYSVTLLGDILLSQYHYSYLNIGLN